ncbi:MAG: Rieske (2Fe-2S) protein [Planctomycetes bacterium]|nr:Rieske (2Fe-2S) protein [Planctomycetota bacterium]
MKQWHSVGPTDHFPPESGREVVVGNRVLAVFRVGEAFYALDGLCDHQAGPLGRGALNGHVVTCPWHGWRYDVRSGQHVDIPSLVHGTFATRVEQGELFVEIAVDGAAAP